MCRRAWRFETAGALGLALLSGAYSAGAQTTDTNVVTASSDAFGVAIGVEALGVYNPAQVRGFDPIAAGNARIEGLYADVHGTVIPYGPLPARLVQDVRIRVGLAAAGFAFPSPTGIVDFSLRSPLGKAGVSSTLYVGPYHSLGFDLDVHAPFAGERCGVGGGVTRRYDEFVPDGTQYTSDVGALVSCRAADAWSATAFYGRTSETKQAVFPFVYLTTAPTPPTPDGARNTGPAWAFQSTVLTDYGAMFSLEAPGRWTIRAGVFRSVWDQPYSGTDLMNDPDAAGIAAHQYVAYPDQPTASTSGELRATHLTPDGPRQHELILTVRARDVEARYGGYDQVDLGTLRLGTRTTLPAPQFTYGPTTGDHTTQWTAGAAYALHWSQRFDLEAGVEQVQYERSVEQPGVAAFDEHETPFLYYASAAAPITRELSAYAGLTRGLEDSGLAPASATNRGQLLPAGRTSQAEAGLKYSAGSTSVVAGIFEVEKPYYNIAADGSYAALGTERHPGVELSLTAQPLAGLALVAGAVFMAPVVQLTAGTQGVGTTPVGEPRRLLQLAADYKIPPWPRLSLDATLTEQSAEAVRVDNGAWNPAQTIINVGGRYRFTILGQDATLRAQVQNVTNQRTWFVVDNSGGLVAYPPQHMALAYLSTEF
jgi:iron complex outermembrane receptor protein